ncbi:MAG: hypothetical protein R3B93_16210 [Bacteroidia bacterium]
MPPIAKKIPHIHSKHNHQRQDDYYWLRDRENPEVIAYLEAENVYTKRGGSGTYRKSQNELFEMKGRIKRDDSSVPYKLDDYFITHCKTGKEYPIYCRKKESLKGEEEIYLDVNQLAEGQSFCQVGGLTVSRNHRYLAYGVDFVGRRIYQVNIKDLQTGEILSEKIDHATGNITWANDNQTLFYSIQDEQTLRSHKIFKHKLGTDPTDDELIYEETDDTFRVYVGKTKSKKYILINSSARWMVDLRPQTSPTETFQIFLQKKNTNIP